MRITHTTSVLWRTRAVVLYNKLDNVGWFEAKVNRMKLGIPAAIVKKNINLGTRNTLRIDLAQKQWSHDIISRVHCLTSLRTVAEL